MVAAGGGGCVPACMAHEHNMLRRVGQLASASREPRTWVHATTARAGPGSSRIARYARHATLCAWPEPLPDMEAVQGQSHLLLTFLVNGDVNTQTPTAAHTLERAIDFW